MRSFQAQSLNSKLSRNSCLISSFFSFGFFLYCHLNVSHSFFSSCQVAHASWTADYFWNQKLSSMVASFFSSVSRGAIDFEYNINLNRQHIVHAGLFRLNIYMFIKLDSYLFLTSMVPFLLDTELQFTFSTLFWFCNAPWEPLLSL